MKNKYVLYHHPCPDGTGAALAAWLVLREDADYIGVNYGQPPPEMEKGSAVYILDFSYPRPVLKELAKTHLLVLLDHHATAEKDLEGLEVELRADPETTRPHWIRFDMSKSGAVLAWEYFHGETAVPEFILYLQDRDLWQFKLPASREVSMALRSYPFDFRLWARISGLISDPPDSSVKPLVAQSNAIHELRKEGVVCKRLTDAAVDAMCENARWVYFDPRAKTIRFTPKLEPGGEGDPMVPAPVYIGPVVNASTFFSECGERLLELNPAVQWSAYYFDRSDKRQWGLRARPGFDAATLIAKPFGGGGHPAACGFVQDL